MSQDQSKSGKFLGRLLERFPESLKKRWEPIRDSLRHAFRPTAGDMVLHQSHLWSRVVIWVIIGTILASVIWACLAPMDQVVHVTGKLRPRGSVREVQAPVSGVIEQVFVKEGQSVAEGEALVSLDRKVAAAEVGSLESQLRSMQIQQSFYDQLFTRQEALATPRDLAPEVADLAKSHASLVAEDKLLRAILDDSGKRAELNLDQSAQLDTEIRNYEENLLSIQEQLKQAREIESKSGEIFNRYKQLAKKQVASDLEMMSREVSYIQAVARVKELESQEQNLTTTFRKDLRTRLAENTKRIAGIEADLSRSKLENNQRISQVEGSLAAARESLVYHEIKSPSAGTVFEIVASKPGAVVAAKDVVLKIVPDDELIAEVDITNHDIGFISPGMRCEVEVDTFPKREFGYIEGEIYLVGADALPPSDIKPFYSFPAKISLGRQSLQVRGKEIPLQPGMSVGVNIKIRDRLVINFFLDTLLGPMEKVRELR
jgi:hemolysin D